MGFVLIYVVCLVLWKYKLQTFVSLSRFDLDQVSLLHALRGVNPFMAVVGEFKKWY